MSKEKAGEKDVEEILDAVSTAVNGTRTGFVGNLKLGKFSEPLEIIGFDLDGNQGGVLFIKVTEEVAKLFEDNPEFGTIESAVEDERRDKEA